MGNEIKRPKQDRELFYYSAELEILAQMFSYPDLHTIGKIEMQSLVECSVSGVAGVCFFDDAYHVGRLSWSDIINDNGVSNKCIITGRTWSREFYTVNIAYYRSYYTQCKEPLEFFARMFADTDSAQKCLIRNTKYTPIPVASTEAERSEYETAMKRIQRGEEITVLVRPSSNNFLKENRELENDRILTISDPTMIEKMHFLSEYHAELKKRFAALYGMCFKSSSKSAQTSIDEIHGMDNFSLILPYVKLYEMKKFADKCKKIFGWSGSESVDFTELWKRENKSALLASEGKDTNDENGGE